MRNITSAYTEMQSSADPVLLNSYIKISYGQTAMRPGPHTLESQWKEESMAHLMGSLCQSLLRIPTLLCRTGLV